MKSIEIFEGNFTLDQVKENSDKFYVITDNTLKSGFSPFRELNNVLFLRIKRGSSSKSAAFYSNSELNDFKKLLLEDIIKIKMCLLQDKSVVLSSLGYGNIEKINNFGTEIKQYLDEYLKSNLQFDNISGKKYVHIPSYNEIEKAPSLQIDTLHYNTLNSNQIIGAILMLKKIGLTIESEIKPNSLIKLKSSITDDVIICRILDCYSCSNINPIEWSMFEICDINKYDTNKFQIIIDFICTINPNGIMKFNNDIFGIQKRAKQQEEPSHKIESDEIQQIKEIEENIIDQPIPVINLMDEKVNINDQSNDEIIFLLKQINQKLDQLITQDQSPKKWWKWPIISKK